MSIVRIIAAVLLVVVLVVVGGSMYALTRVPTGRGEDVVTRAGTWLRVTLHIPVKLPPGHGDAHVFLAASQDHVFAVARDPSAWMPVLTRLERDPDADVTTTGTPGQVGYMIAWSSTTSRLVYQRGSIAVTSVQPSSLVGLHVTLEDGGTGDVTIRVTASSQTQVEVVAELPPSRGAAVFSHEMAGHVADALEEVIEHPRVGEVAAAAPDLGAAQRPRISWHVQSCKNAPGCTQNGFSRTCAEAGMKTVRITVTDEHTNKKVVTRAPCPPSATDGEVMVDVPRGVGPFQLAASSDDVATARSEMVCHITPRCWSRGISLNLYALGCNDPECTACLDAGHAPGWCE